QQKIATQRVIGQNSITAAEARVNDAKNVLAAAEAELALKRAPASNEELAAQNAYLKQSQANLSSQRARVREAQAAVSALESQLADNNLAAPFSGTVTRQEAKVGEIVSPGAPLVSVMSEAKFEIEANLPEIDVSKIQIGNTATATLDAYGNDVIFDALVVSIDPAETMVEGVSTYKVKIQFSQDDERIKSGMTANVTILAASRENALVIPQRAVIEQNGKKIVRVLYGEGRKQSVEEVVVKIGLRSTDGNVEIIEGITEGDQVAISKSSEK
ncbi:MAG: efflux RND transporter periplasmic adaptor subunit, partial [Candidatus Komeilibacteria bacterium]|nr:efflux RND transporter periplasmic adaptor subunit [Candidatus Komeilibacteria bacterium]